MHIFRQFSVSSLHPRPCILGVFGVEQASIFLSITVAIFYEGNSITIEVLEHGLKIGSESSVFTDQMIKLT